MQMLEIEDAIFDFFNKNKDTNGKLDKNKVGKLLQVFAGDDGFFAANDELLTENSTKFTKEGIYFETTVTSVAYVKSKVVRYFKLDENYLPHTVVLEPEINNYVNTVKPKSSEIILPVSNWTGDASPYSQVVTITGATSNMRVDLMPTAV